MNAHDRAPRLVLIAFAMLLAACATVDVTTTQYLGAPRYQPTEPTAVQILRTEPTAPHDRLGEIMVEASTEPAPPITEIEQKVCKAAAKLGADAVVVVYDRIQPVGAYLSGPWWGRSVETVSGRKLIAVAIRYKR
jgi:energy-converting hydrogenase Eha subunit F